jgi:hypothetical protein
MRVKDVDHKKEENCGQGTEILVKIKNFLFKEGAAIGRAEFSIKVKEISIKFQFQKWGRPKFP